MLSSSIVTGSYKHSWLHIYSEHWGSLVFQVQCIINIQWKLIKLLCWNIPIFVTIQMHLKIPKANTSMWLHASLSQNVLSQQIHLWQSSTAQQHVLHKIKPTLLKITKANINTIHDKTGCVFCLQTFTYKTLVDLLLVCNNFGCLDRGLTLELMNGYIEDIKSWWLLYHCND